MIQVVLGGLSYTGARLGENSLAQHPLDGLAPLLFCILLDFN